MLSIIIPNLNESESLEELRQQIVQTCDEHGIDFEILFIDDGSTDDSWDIVTGFVTADPRIRGIRFRRNFGKAAALTAGMRAARGERLMMMDADLQDDPAEIPRFLAQMDEGFDVVNGWKVRRLDPWHKTYPSKVFNWMVGAWTGLRLHDHNCGFKMFRKDVAAEIRIYGELHRFIAVLAFARGFRVTELSVHHRPRQFGHSKYGVRRFLRGLLDLVTVKFLTGFSQRPLHLLGGVGLFLFGLGSVGLSYLGTIWVLMNLTGWLNPEPIGSRPLLAYSIGLTLLGAQALSLGLLAELQVARSTRDDDMFSIAEQTDNESDESGIVP